MRISEKMHNLPISQPPTPITLAGLILTITVGILPPAKLLAEDLTKATLREGSPNLLKVTPKFISWKTTNESTHSHDADHRSGPKDSTAPSSRQDVLATCSSVPGSSGGAAGSSGQGPGEPKQEVAHLTTLVLDDDEFTNDPYQIIHTEGSSLFQPFHERISRDLMKGTFYSRGDCIQRDLLS